MVALLIALISIGAITTLTWFLNERRFLPIKVCAVCAGTAGTWIWLLVAVTFGWLPFVSYMPVIAILMGGSVVGIAYQGEKYLKSGHLPAGQAGSSLLWKALFIPIGFGTVWSVTHFAFGFVIIGALILLSLVWWFLEFPRKNGDTARTKYLEKEMEQCC